MLCSAHRTGYNGSLVDDSDGVAFNHPGHTVYRHYGEGMTVSKLVLYSFHYFASCTNYIV